MFDSSKILISNDNDDQLKKDHLLGKTSNTNFRKFMKEVDVHSLK